MNLYSILASSKGVLDTHHYAVLAASAESAKTRVLKIKGLIGIKTCEKCSEGQFFVATTFLDAQD